MRKALRSDQIHAGQLFQQFDLYSRIIMANWMRHREFLDGVESLLRRVTSAPLRILDLGCGDGYLAAIAFRNRKILSYAAVDLSRDALDRLLARGPIGLQHQSMTVPEIHCCDIQSALDALAPASSDIILASYSLHHFDDETKRCVLGKIRRGLSENGLFIWIDVARLENESRDSYIGRITDWIKQDWDCLSEAERAASVQHVIESDFPETEEGMLQLARSHELKPFERLYWDDFYGGWAFSAIE